MGENLIAFDIGESQVKLIWYTGKTCKKAVCAALPDNLVANGEIISMDAMADFLKETAKQNGIPRANAAVILPESLVFTRNVEVPAMTDAQLAYNLPYEFKDYLNQEKTDYFFDYAVQELVEDDESEAKQMKLFACAALKKTIDDYRDMFRRAGFRLKSAIPEEAAYAAVLAACPNMDSDTCFVDIGYRGIRMQFFREDSFVTRRTVNLGVCDLVLSLAEARSIDTHMAYEHMRSNYEDALNEQSAQNLYRSMAVEIMKAVNFYNYNNREQMLNRIYLCGGGAAIEPIRKAIIEMTDMEIHSSEELLPENAVQDEPWIYTKAVGCALQA